MSQLIEERIKALEFVSVNKIIDISNNEHFGIFDIQNVKVHEFIFTNKDYDNGKWWDGHRLVPMTKTFIGLCENLDSICKKYCAIYLTPAGRSEDSVSTGKSEDTIDCEHVVCNSESLAFDDNDAMQSQYNFAFTMSLKSQLTSFLVCGYLAVGMCIRCKRAVYCQESVDQVTGVSSYTFKCSGSQCGQLSPVLYKYKDASFKNNMTMKELVSFVDAAIKEFAYGDCVYYVRYMPRAATRKVVVNRFYFHDSKFVDHRIIDHKATCSMICQVVIYKRQP